MSQRSLSDKKAAPETKNETLLEKPDVSRHRDRMARQTRHAGGGLALAQFFVKHMHMQILTTMPSVFRTRKVRKSDTPSGRNICFCTTMLLSHLLQGQRPASLSDNLLAWKQKPPAKTHGDTLQTYRTCNMQAVVIHVHAGCR